MKDVAIDPFDFVTIASVCMGVYKTKHLLEEWKVNLNGGKEWKKGKSRSMVEGQVGERRRNELKKKRKNVPTIANS